MRLDLLILGLIVSAKKNDHQHTFEQVVLSFMKRGIELHKALEVWFHSSLTKY